MGRLRNLASRRKPLVEPVANRSMTLRDLSVLEAVRWSLHRADVPAGPVTSWASRGYVPKLFVPGNAPTRDERGVKFAKDTPQYLVSSGGEADASASYRWGVHNAYCDIAGNPGVEFARVLYINGLSGGPAYTQPFVYFKPYLGLMGVMWQDPDGACAVEGPCSTDPAVCNSLTWWWREGRLFGEINGVMAPSVEFKSAAYNNGAPYAQLGAYTGQNNGADLWLADSMLGTFELSDDCAMKIASIGMRDAGRLADLVALGHPYSAVEPVVSEDDFGFRHQHDEVAWQAYMSAYTNGVNPAQLTARHAHRGEAMVARTGWVPIFSDHFTSNTVADAEAGALGSNWFGPHVISPGMVDAGVVPAQRLTDTNAYSQSGSEIRLRHYNDGAWKTASFASVNHNGYGRTWKAPWIRRVLFRYATSAPAWPTGMLYSPAWGYDDLYLKQRTRNRWEFDDLESIGFYPRYVSVTNWGAHPRQVPSTFQAPGIRHHDDYEKVAGYECDVDTGFPGPLNLVDGAIHELITIADVDGMLYGYIDGREMYRDPIQPVMRDMPLSWVVAAGDVDPASFDPAHTTDMFIDLVEVSVPAASLTVVPPEGFTARPALSGALTVNSVLTLDPKLVATITGQATIRWHRTDGTTIPAAHNSLTYQLTAAEVGLGVRVEVINAGVKDKPRAWTADTAAVAGSAAWTPAVENVRHFAWWDFQDVAATTVVNVSGTDRFSVVNDKSGNNRHATNTANNATQPAVAAASTIGGKRAARSDPSLGDPMMSVANIADLPASNYLMSINTSAAQLQVAAGLVGGSKLSGNVFSTDVAAIACFHWGSFGWEWVVNGVVVASDYASAQSTSGAAYAVLSINGTGGGAAGRVFDLFSTGPVGFLFNRVTAGTGRGWDGDIGEIILRTFNHDIETRQKYEGYLAHRWWGAGAANPLAADHPYKSTPPT
jgi:hypothetical protein